MIRSYRDGTALVTGAASGIGLALSRALAFQGAEVVLADLQGELAARRAAEIVAEGGQATAAQLDVRDPEAFDALAERTLARTGRIDYLFNNAGIGIGGEVANYDHSVWADTFDVNIRGVTNGIQAVYPRMIEQGFGHIINTASMAGLLPAMPFSASYCGSKHAVVGLTLSLRIEATVPGVRVSVLCPGVIRTPILEGGGKFGRMIQQVPDELMKRMWEDLRPMDAARFAARVLRAAKRNPAVIIVPGWWRLLWWTQRLAPWLVERLSRRQYLGMRCELP